MRALAVLWVACSLACCLAIDTTFGRLVFLYGYAIPYNVEPLKGFNLAYL